MSQAQLAKVQTRSRRQAGSRLGYESVPADYDVASAFDYVPLTMKLEDLQAKALADRPDLRARQQGITAANSRYELQKAIGSVDPTGIAPLLTREQLEQCVVFRQRSDSDFQPQPRAEILRGKIRNPHAGGRTGARSERSGDDGRDERVRRRAHERSDRDALPLRLSERRRRISRDISEYAYKRGAASLLDFLDAERSYRATELAPQGRPARVVSNGGGATRREAGGRRTFACRTRTNKMAITRRREFARSGRRCHSRLISQVYDSRWEFPDANLKSGTRWQEMTSYSS